VLIRALLQRAEGSEVSSVKQTPFGARYLVDGRISGPTGSAALIRNVWFVENDERSPRVFTAYLLRGVQKWQSENTTWWCWCRGREARSAVPRSAGSRVRGCSFCAVYWVSVVAAAEQKRGLAMNWYMGALGKYATFEGRARRKEYWFFMLFNFFAVVVLTVVDMAIGTFSEQAEIGLFGSVYLLAVLIPSVAVTVRRLHDTNRSGWWVLLNVIPVIGEGTPSPIVERP
jgi:uncharacterized membrane protein YhaH (DUF805 family)